MIQKTSTGSLLLPLSSTQPRGQTDQKFSQEPIALIGIGCRFPGGINNPETFWQLLLDKVDAITDMPPGRFDVDAFYDPTPAEPGKIATRQGGFLTSIDQFDAGFFGISPREAIYIDPQQRLLLEVAWEALEDGGQVIDQLAGSQTGVFIGMWTSDYEDKMYDTSSDIDLYVTTGGGRYAASGRLSYIFDFQGPSLTIDTACSSSLVTVHLACRSLWAGESTLALAGGVNLILEPQISIGYSRSKMLSPDGRCKFGDARANGYVRSEGVGLVVLKPLAQALADKDPIYALIRGSAVNNDGRSSGLLVSPGMETQAAMLREAYRQAGVCPGQVSYVEAHGTGTRVGDPVELQALGRVLGENRPPDQPCRVGSVKTNIGHTEAASGIAGVIKAALCLKHRAIPANLHFQQPNPGIPWSELPLVIQSDWSAWPNEDHPAFAGVNSFGVTGTNAHIVLAEAPALSKSLQEQPAQAYLLPLSAHTPAALKTLAQAYHTLLTSPQAPAPAPVSYSAACRRAHHQFRLALVGDNQAELADHLAAFLQDEKRLNMSADQTKADHPAKIVFVCPGQGAQWVGMGRQLLAQEPVFAEALKRCEQAMQPFVDWSLLEQLQVDPESPVYRLDEIDVIQPALFAIQVALSAVWRAWGIEPDAVIGHSLGEVAAAHIAGALSLEDAARVICRRSQLMRQVSGQGAMAVVGLSIEKAEEALHGYEGRVSVAVHNSPQSTVISGEPAVMTKILDQLRAQDVFCRPVKVDVASHSPQMDPLRVKLVESLGELRPQTASIPIYSTVDQAVSDGSTFDAAYWGRNLRQTVHFSTMVQRLLADDYTIFIELSPHPILLNSIGEILTHLGRAGHTLPSLRREQPERVAMLGTLGALYTLGHPIDWPRLFPEGGQVVRLPAYPWQRERFWLETDNVEPVRAGRRLSSEHLDSPPQRPASPDLNNWLYELRWELAPRTAAAPVASSNSGPWLIFADKQGVGETLAARLNQQGAASILIKPGETWADLGQDRFVVNPEHPEDMRQLLAAVAPPGTPSCQGVVHLWGLDTPASSELTSSTLEAAQILNCGSALHLIQALAQAEWAEQPRLWLVTQGAQPVLPADQKTLTVAQAPLWGFGRAIAEEHAEFWGGLIDLDPAAPADQRARLLHAEITTPTGADQLAFRQEQRYALRLVRAPKPETRGQNSSFRWRVDGAYLITGGLGDIGGQVARWMVEQGARRLILLGRTPLPPRMKWNQVDPDSSLGRKITIIRELEAMGASVHLAPVDVADETQLKEFLDSYQREGWPPIRGVAHAAGILDNRLLGQLDLATFKRVWRSKVIGGWLLHSLVDDVDLFLLFSSLISILAQPGQSNYAAANTFLDALAHYRHGQSQTGLSVNWGVWAGLGLVATATAQRNVEQMIGQGFNSLTLPQGLEILEYLLPRNFTQVVAAPVDWATLRRVRAANRQFPFLAHLWTETDAHQPEDRAGTTGSPEDSLPESLLAAEPHRRQELLAEHIRLQVARVLRLSPTRIIPDQPLGSFGLDSLMAVELRNRLEASLGLTLSATLVWNYPTVNQLAPFLLSKLDLSPATPAAQEPAVKLEQLEQDDKPKPSAMSDILADVSAISDEEALRALRSKK